MLTRCSPWVASCLAVFVLAASAPPAGAAGFALFEQGARGMGFAGAFTAQASDPSAIFHNAAGIAFLKGKQIYLGGTAIAPSFSFTGAEPFPGSTVSEKSDVGISVPPAAYYSQGFTDRLAFGVGVNVPFGLKTRWANPDLYTGRFVSTSAELKGYSINPTVGYKLADRLAVGAGVDLRLSTVILERRVGVVNPFTQKVVDAADVRLESDTGFGLGFNVGLLAKPSESFSIGLAYRHKVKVDYGGNASFNQRSTGNAQLDALVSAVLPSGQVPLSTSVEFPGFASLGLAYHAGDWIVEGDVNWYRWSSFDRVNLVFEGSEQLNQVLTENYENSLQYRLGIERTLTDAWAVRGGYFFDESPSPAASVSPILPDASRHGIALGGTWKSGQLRVDAATWLLFSPERSTEGVNRDGYNGTYKSHAFTLGLFLGYAF
jgi:long-chain fatty acid transport protein